MLKRLTEREQIETLLDQYTAALRQAFLAAIEDITSRLVLAAIVARLEKGDVAGAVEAIGVERGAFNPVLDELARAYNAGGGSAADNFPTVRDPEGFRVSIRFDARNLRAETWLRQHSAELVTNIVDEQRATIRSALESGLASGTNPRTVALDIVGRLDRATGSRVGGIIGLSAPQAAAVDLASQELTSGEIEGLRNYLTRARRDRRFDKTVLAAIETGKPIPAELRARIVGRYADRLLQLRGEMLARTETLTALNAARTEAMHQAVDAGKVDGSTVTSVWHSVHDDRTRYTHREMDGQKVPFGQPFHSPSGAALRFPGDPSAPASEIVGCRCFVSHEIDFLAGLQ
jgi:hypothetical protein